MDYDFTIVYKTYEPDLEWIKYSLLGIQKFVTDYIKIIIYCHDQAVEKLQIMLKEIRLEICVIPVFYDFHGYIKAGVVKCECFRDITTKYVVILDSDTIFKKPVNLSNLLLRDGKIEWFYADKNDNNDSAIQECFSVWREAYESMTKSKQDFHFMANGFPFVFTRNSLEDAYYAFKTLHSEDYSEFCNRRLKEKGILINNSIQSKFRNLATVFNEFEWLGFFFKNNSPDYVFLNVNSTENRERIRERNEQLFQYWSHGGITDNIRQEIHMILQL